MTLYRGNREIQLLFLGRGHTNGDTVVYLPKEKIVCTGDLMESRPAYMGNGVFDEWIKTLDALKKLDFNTVLPGHGVPFHDKALITAYQSYLQDLVYAGCCAAQAGAHRRSGRAESGPHFARRSVPANHRTRRGSARCSPRVRMDGREPTASTAGLHSATLAVLFVWCSSCQ